MARKQTSEPMETQAVANWENSGAPMRASPSKGSRTARKLQPAIPPAEAEAKRRSSLKKQRSQLKAIVKPTSGPSATTSGK
jgi:hypothetical protein